MALELPTTAVVDDNVDSADVNDCSLDGIEPTDDDVVCDSPTATVVLVEKFDSGIVDVTGDESVADDCVVCCCCWLLVHVAACDWFNCRSWFTWTLTTELAAELTADCWPGTTVFSGEPSTVTWKKCKIKSAKF